MPDNATPDPAAVWASFAPNPQQPRVPASYSMPREEAPPPRWRWTWWGGITYGNVPWGLIVGTIITLARLAAY